jgi:hyperosmotically inducible periplasmic protein
MRYIRTFLILAIAILGVSSIEISAQNNFSAQQTIEKKISKEINMLPFYGVFDNITFKFDGSNVTLSGSVVRPTTKSDIGNIVKKMKGVNSVVNNIEVLPLSSFDDQIRLQTLQTFANRGGGLGRYIQEPLPSMRIIVANGRVSLEGYVANKSDADLANILAKGVFGVFDVQNSLIVDKERSN